MDRKKFMNSFKGIDEFLLASLCDDIELCEEIEYAVYTKYFYPPQIWNKLINENSLSYLKFIPLGLNKDAERRLIAIAPKDFDETLLHFPVKEFKILGNNKFKDLEHKDFLGTIMSLGIRREFMGDIVVKDGNCYGIIAENLFNLILENISMIGRIPVKIIEIQRSEIPENQFEEFIETVPSLRLDSITSSISNGSRNSAVELIEEGLVSLNYNIERDKSKPVNLGDILSIRKKGKFVLADILGENKKGKIRILLKKFV